jgi:hypothetical protein
LLDFAGISTIAGMASKQSKVTDEHRHEAALLREIWERKQPELRARGHGTQAAFGHEFDIGNQAAVGFFLNGKTPLSAKAARGFATGLGCRVADFSPRLAALLLDLPPTREPTAGDAIAQAFDQVPNTAAKTVLLTTLMLEIGRATRAGASYLPPPQHTKPIDAQDQANQTAHDTPQDGS